VPATSVERGFLSKPEKSGPRIGVRLLALAVLLTVSMFAWQLWHVYNSFRVGNQTLEMYAESERLRDQFVDLNHDLFLSAQMAAMTGAPQWQERYRTTDRDISAAMSHAAQVLDGRIKLDALSRMHAAHLELEKTWDSIFERVRDGSAEQAQAILASEAYTDQRNTFSEASHEFIADVRRYVADRIRAEQHKEFLSVGAAFATFVASLVLWILLIRGIRRGQVMLAEETVHRQQAEAELLQAQKMEAIGQVAAGIAHDFRNSLTAIIGYAGLARKALPEGHPAARPLVSLESAVTQANDLVRGLLAFSRKTTISKEPVELRAVIAEMRQMLIGILPDSVAVVVEGLDQQAIWVSADRMQLQQVLMNLAINARDAMPRGGRLAIGMGCETDAEGSDEKVCITVADTGEGMSPEVLEHIFEPFFTTRPREHGTGLGMAVAHGIVTNHGGAIHVSSQVGKGTTVTVELPVITVPSTGVIEAREIGLCPAGQGELILLAEDNRHVREVMAETLQAVGFRTIQVPTGEQLLGEFSRHAGSIRLLIVDFDLPGRNGLDCIREIREEAGEIPVICVTATTDPAIENELSGESLVLRKPFAMTTLTRLASRMITSTVSSASS
jgi:two-component system, cell cycle sensor histidine kinase and response regulator CckA